MPFQVMLHPANTISSYPNSGKVTLFFSAPPTTAAFKIFEDSIPGIPSHLVIANTTTYFQDTRYGQTNSYFYSIDGQTVGNEEYYTIEALDRNGIVLHTSNQVQWKTSSTGLPWDNSNATTIGQAVYSSIINASGIGNVNYFDCVGPNLIMYSIDSNQNVSWEKYEPGNTDFITPSNPQIQFPEPDGNDAPNQPGPFNKNEYGNSAGPYDKFESLPGYSHVRAPLYVPAYSENGTPNYVRNAPANQANFSKDVFDLYEGGQIGSTAIDAGISWDHRLDGTANGFWSPIISISQKTNDNFWDGGFPAGLPDPNQTNGQFNGKVRILDLIGVTTSSFSMTMDYQENLSDPAVDGFICLTISNLNGTSLCDTNLNELSGNSFAVCAYNPTFTQARVASMRVKTTASIAQKNVDQFNSYVNDGSQFLNWAFGDYFGLSPILIAPSTSPAALSLWDTVANGGQGGYWMVCPSYGQNNVIQPVLGQTSGEYYYLFNYIILPYGPLS